MVSVNFFSPVYSHNAEEIWIPNFFFFGYDWSLHKSVTKTGEAFIRGGSRIFFRRGCTTQEWRNWLVTGLKQILIANTKKKAGYLRGGGGAHPLHPPPRSAHVPKTPFETTLLWTRGFLNLRLSVFVWTENILETELFRKRWRHDNHVISLPQFSSNTSLKWAVTAAFSNSSGEPSGVVWTKNIACVFRVKRRLQIPPT